MITHLVQPGCGVTLCDKLIEDVDTNGWSWFVLNPGADPKTIALPCTSCVLRHVFGDPKSSTGIKHDSDKLRFDLLPLKGLHHVAKVATDGAKRYGEGNWRQVESPESRYLAALWRHLVAHTNGEHIDPQHGTPHLAHIAWGCLALLELGEPK